MKDTRAEFSSDCPFLSRILMERTASGVYRRRKLDLEDVLPFRSVDLTVGDSIS